MSWHNDFILTLRCDTYSTVKIIPEQLVLGGHITPEIIASYAHSMESPLRRATGDVPADREWSVERAHRG